MTPEDLRQLVVSLPEVEEKSHFGTPDFRLKNKIIGTLHAAEGFAVVKVTAWEMEALPAADPVTFESARWGTQNWMRIHLAGADPAHVRELYEEAWRRIAPKKLLALLPRPGAP